VGYEWSSGERMVEEERVEEWRSKGTISEKMRWRKTEESKEEEKRDRRFSCGGEGGWGKREEREELR
jgi:hypothetical protein